VGIVYYSHLSFGCFPSPPGGCLVVFGGGCGCLLSSPLQDRVFVVGGRGLSVVFLGGGFFFFFFFIFCGGF